jgi:hypothetical protein
MHWWVDSVVEPGGGALMATRKMERDGVFLIE